MRKILITNDDGIDSDGLMRLAKCAANYGRVWIVAPDGQRSAMSHSITLRHPFDLKKVDYPVEGVCAYSCTGTPADCVRVGVLNIVPEKPDVIFAGINAGYNCATDIQYSATLGAAFEGLFQGIPSFAFSEGIHGRCDATDEYLSTVMEELLKKEFEPDFIWNVNFPMCEMKDFKGIRWNTKVSKKCTFEDTYTEETLEDGTIRMVVHGEPAFIAEEGTDYKALLEGYISVGKVENIC
ncbi:MAG: 5'/3'-nucleotidase SurE [Lachnospiraceae bacterium]|nr:5'/3'-nucleotidase SurE [Lachnospiraceae bacterium]